MKIDSLGGALRSSQSARKYPGNFGTVIIDLILLTREPGIRIYATQLDFSRYLFSQSTLLDNYGVIHVVNNKALLDKGSFVLVRARECIKASTTQFLIISHSTRIIKNIINKEKGKK